jgi:ligand-binding sensor domain-containing protein
LWIGTEKGLACYVNNHFILFNKSNGLHFNAIYGIIDDGNGFVWLSGNFGLERIAVDELKALKQRKTKVIHARLFGASDGMANAETNGGIFPCVWQMKDGSIWFPTVKGIAIVQPWSIHDNLTDVNIHIQAIRFCK